MAELRLEIPDDHDYPAPDHMIIWLDDHIGKPNEYKKIKSAFSSNIDPRHQTWTTLTDPDYEKLVQENNAKSVRFADIPMLLLTCDNIIKCYEAFEANKDRHIYFITSGTLGKFIIPRLIERHQQLFKDPITKKPYSSIYIFCGYTVHHYEWLVDFRDHVQVFDHEDILLARLTHDVAQNFVEQGEYCINESLARFQRSKKVLNRYLAMGEVCASDLEHVEKMIANVERILKPNIANPHVEDSIIVDNIIQQNNDDDNVQVSQATS
ncbi:hypothetical protein I4U23_026041 [Adineta vaga]|nr:hypothetical protein I4U23_026041 [Adineta vaga]